MIYEKVIVEVMDEILQDKINYLALSEKLHQLKSFLLKITELDLNNFEDRKDLEFGNGIALCTTFAALCIDDIMRTRQFVRGVYQAIKDKQKENNNPVHLFYAGTGPFATLILPILSRISPEEIRLTLLDVNEKTLDYLNCVIEELSIEPYIDQIICADASTYQFDVNQQIDVLVSETMQHGLVKEQQVPIMINLVSQLSQDSIVIPNNIQLDLAQMNSSSELYPEAKRHLVYKRLKRLLDFTPEFIRTIDTKQKNFALCSQIDFLDDQKGYDRLVILTSIQVYKDEWIHVDLSGLTIPKFLLDLNREKNRKHISLSYVIKEQPNFELELG